MQAYNMGVRTAVQSQQTRVALDRECDIDDKHQIIKSSVRGRINAWLPLYINRENWKFASIWAPSAFSIIATQFNDMFKPEHALRVCSKVSEQSFIKDSKRRD